MFTTKLRVPVILALVLGPAAVEGRHNHLFVTAAPVPVPRKAPKELLEKRREVA